MLKALTLRVLCQSHSDIILNIDLILITEFDTLNCDDIKKRTNNQKNVAIYINAKHD